MTFISKPAIGVLDVFLFCFCFYHSALNRMLSYVTNLYIIPHTLYVTQSFHSAVQTEQNHQAHSILSVLSVHILRTSKLSCLLLRFTNLALDVNVFIYSLATQHRIHTELLLRYSCFFPHFFFPWQVQESEQRHFAPTVTKVNFLTNRQSIFR